MKSRPLISHWLDALGVKLELSVLKILKSIGIGLLIVFVAMVCFIIATYLERFGIIKSLALYSVHGPIENIFLVLITVVIGFVYLAAGLTETKLKVTSEGWFVFFGCLVVFGLFGISGVTAFAVLGKIFSAVYMYFKRTKI